MYSVNASVPPAVEGLRDAVADELDGFERVVEAPTLVVKRLGRQRPAALEVLADRVEAALEGWGPVAARVDELGVFVDPPSGAGPVVYLAVESPGLRALHRDLVGALGVANPTVEGANYVPHVTLARDGNRADAAALSGRSVGPLEWTVDRLELYDARHGQPVRAYPLPVGR
ncbi:MAG: 2'-5' RNA ligase family protein [Halobacteriales archaeon]